MAHTEIELNGNAKSKRACETCKRRKKRCSGGLPCEYCVKIGNPQGCEYKTRLTKKKVKVSERYIASLKSKIRILENRLATLDGTKDSSKPVEEFIGEENPLIETITSPSEEKEHQSLFQNNHMRSSDLFDVKIYDKSERKLQMKYSGDSACLNFLRRIQHTLLSSAGMEKLDQDLTTKHIEFAAQITWDSVWQLASDIPRIQEARQLISAAGTVIGSDYLFMDNNYGDVIVPSMFYRSREQIEHEYSALMFAEELALFYSYLALGYLFQPSRHSNGTIRTTNGFAYFEKSLQILGTLFKHFDQCIGPSLIQAFLYVAYFGLSVDKSAFAYVMVGNAIRIAFTLGIHKTSATPKNNRIFWLCFLYDRLLAIRFGFPLLINEIEIEIPSCSSFDTDFLSISLEKYHFEAQVSLAKITTNIIKRIYTKNSSSFVHNCHAVLKELKDWFDGLPSELKFDYNNFSLETSRPTVNLHINYNYLIILTTRSVVFYVFNKLVSSGKTTDELFAKNLREIIIVLFEASINAAQIQSVILTRLYYAGRMMNRSFLDCHYIFNSSVVLILAAFIQSLPNYLLNESSDVNILFSRVQDNLDVLQRISQYNVAGFNFNKQLTELIELISCEQVQKMYNGNMQRHSLNATSAIETFTIALKSPSVEEKNNSYEGQELLSHMDLSEVLELMTSSNGYPNSGTSHFDEDDFLKFSNFML